MAGKASAAKATKSNLKSTANSNGKRSRTTTDDAPDAKRPKRSAAANVDYTAKPPRSVVVEPKKAEPKKSARSKAAGTAAKGADAAAKPKTTTTGRGRGRPPGSKNKPKDGVTAASTATKGKPSTAAAGDAPKKRGRPPGAKNKPKTDATATQKTTAASGTDTDAATPAKKRGRPPGSANKKKVGPTNTPKSAVDTPGKRPRGRPPGSKNKTPKSDKKRVSFAGPGVISPEANDADVDAEGEDDEELPGAVAANLNTEGEASVKKGRGRPRKSGSVAGTPAGSAVKGASTPAANGTLAKKGRGRPSKSRHSEVYAPATEQALGDVPAKVEDQLVGDDEGVDADYAAEYEVLDQVLPDEPVIDPELVDN